jgi:transposase-like protein
MMARSYRDAGWSLRAIARELRIGIETVRRDLKACPASVSFMAPHRPKRDTSGTAGENVVRFRRQA